MMAFLFFLLLDSGAKAERETLVIPAILDRPQVRWADLDGDGHLEVWARDGDRQVWILPGGGDKQFQALEFDPIDLPVFPVKTADGWRARIYRDGMLLHFEPGSGWNILTDYAFTKRARPGLDLIGLGTQALAPTYDGYWLVQDQCLLQHLPAMPSLTLSDHQLTLTWPIPVRRDLDGAGGLDFISDPILFRQNGEIRIWHALEDQGKYRTGWSALQFPDRMEVAGHQMGDVDGDGFEELVVLARPIRDMSIFEEMSFVVYLGTGPGQWQETPHQVLKSKQNLWQTGPIEVGPEGVTLYYYKGLFKAFFRLDRYSWNEDGFIEPKSVKESWRVRGADRDVIFTGRDLNGDGSRDLVLRGRDGLWVYYRDETAPMPFDKEKGELLVGLGGHDEFGPPMPLGRLGDHYVRRNGGLALVKRDNQMELWQLSRKDNGHWRLDRLL